MALTEQQQQSLLGVTSFMFDYAPDQASYDRFASILEQNPSFYDLGTDLAKTDAFQSQYDGTTQGLINLVFGRLGITEDTQAYTRGTDFITQRLDAGVSEGQVLMEVGEKLLQDTPPEGLEDAAAILQNKIAVSQAYLESGAEGYSSDTIPDLLSGVTADEASVQAAQDKIDAVVNEGETFTLTADDDQFFGTELNDTFEADEGTLSADDQILDQSTTDNDTLNAVITNANKAAGPATLLNVENVNLELDVFTGAAFNAANTTGATITGSSSKLGFNGEFAVSGTGDNNVVAGENVSDLTVTGLEAGTVDTGAAETATVNMAAGEETANVTVNGDIALGVDTADILNLAATADATVTLTDVAGNGAASVTEIVGSGAGVITVEGDLSGVTDITGVDTAVIDTNTTVNASDWDVSNIVVDVDLTNGITVADSASVKLTEAQGGLTVTGKGETSSTATVTSELAAVGTLAFASFASADLELTAADATVTSLDADDVALTVNVADGADITTLIGEDLTLVGAGNVVVDNADAVDVLDASALSGNLELTSADTGSQEVAGAAGDNTVEFTATGNGETATFVGQSGDDEVSFAAAGNVEASFAGGENQITLAQDFAGEASIAGGADADTLTVDGVAGTIAAQLGAGDDVLELGVGTDLSGSLTVDFGEGDDTLALAANADISTLDTELTGLESVTVDTTAIFSGEQLSGAEYSISGGDAQAAITVEGSANDDTIDLSGLSLDDSLSAGITGVTVDLTTNAGGDDTVIGTSIDDTISVDVAQETTLTLGDGADSVEGLAAGAGSVTITDFDADNDSLLDDASTALTAVHQAGSISTEDAATLTDAITAAYTSAASATESLASAGDVLTFEYDGNAYAIIEGAVTSPAAYDASEDMLITLQGVSEADLNAAIA